MFCWLYRFMISNAVDGDNRLSERMQRHIRRCAGCRGFHEMCLSLGKGLSREADRQGADDELPADFGRRVLAAASAQSAETYKLSIWRSRPVIAAACIAVAALLGTLFLTLNQNEPPAPEPQRLGGIYNLIDEDLPKAWAGFVKKPLTDEIENLTEGTESAVRFLVACVTVNPTNAGNELPLPD